MRSLRRLLAVSTALFAFAVGSLASAAPDDEVVARVGSATITRGELERRLAAIPAMQLATFGKDAATVRRAFLEKVVIPEYLLSQGAAEKKIGDRPDIRVRILDAYRTAILHAVQAQIAREGVTDDEVARYFAENKDKFQTPERLNLARILLAKKDDCEATLRDVKQPGFEKKWNDLARDKSTDKATSERGGSLGFVGPDGHSSEVTVKVDPALFQAAQKVKNGEVVPECVKEGEEWAVVWRRGSTPAVTRTLEQEAPTIKTMLTRLKLEKAITDVTQRLRKDMVSDVAYDVLGLVDVTPSGDVAQRQRPGVGRPKAMGKPQPNPANLR